MARGRRLSALLRSSRHQRLASLSTLRGLKPAQPDPTLELHGGGGGGGGSGGGPAAAAAPAVGAICSAAECERVFLELHILYESLKLDTLAWPRLSPLATLLATLAVGTRKWEHAYHYARDFGSLGGYVEAQAALAPASASESSPPPFCLFHSLASSLAASPTPTPPSLILGATLHGGTAAGAPLAASAAKPALGGGSGGTTVPLSLIPPACRLPAVVLGLYARIAPHPARGGGGGGGGAPPPARAARRVARAPDGGRAHRPQAPEALPLGVALPLYDAIRRAATARRRASRFARTT